MTGQNLSARPRLALTLLALGCIAAGGLAGWYWEAHRLGVDASGRLAGRDRAAVEQVVHDYLMAHPEVLPEAMQALEERQTADRLGAIRSEVERPAPGAVLGNPKGRVTLVEFSDYACGYCRASVADVTALIAANPELRVVVRELPILTPESVDAAKWAIAAAEQGRYAQFHNAMYAAGRPSAETIAAAAQTAGLDMARARKVVAAPGTVAELERNITMAKQLGFSGTPAWVAGDAVLTGAVGRDALAKAIADARS